MNNMQAEIYDNEYVLDVIFDNINCDHIPTIEECHEVASEYNCKLTKEDIEKINDYIECFLEMEEIGMQDYWDERKEFEKERELYELWGDE